MNQKIREIMKQPINKDWVEELNELFGIDYSDKNLPSIGITPKVSEIKHFISTLLKQQKQELREKMKKPAGMIDKTFYYNQAIQDILKLL